VPFDFVFHIDTRSRPRMKFHFVWFFGLVDKDIREEKKAPSEKKDKVKPAKKSKSRINRQLIFRIVRIEGLFKQFKQFIKDIFSCFNLKEFVIDCKVHPDDPADTGIIYALAFPVNSLADSCIPYRINIWPSFEPGTFFDGEISGSIRLQPVKLFKPVARLIFSIPTIRLFYIFISNKWKKEK
jgi:hypothetical protein